MPSKQRTRHAADTIITRCLALPPESELAIVADETTLPIAELLAEAADACNHRVHLMYFPSAIQERMVDKPLGESVKIVLRDVAATILCVNGHASCMPFRHAIRRAAWGHGRKVAHMPGVNWRTFLAADADYERLTQWCEGLALALVKGQEICITSFDRARREHVLRAALEPWRRLPIISDGIIHDGAWGNIPSGETYIAPVEGTAEGEIVINGSLPGRVLTLNDELILRFKSGRLIQVTPKAGPTARHLFASQLKLARARGDTNWNNLGEIGFGVNERIQRLTGVPLLDEKKYGTLHIALGDNRDMGGKVESLIHCDMVCLHPAVAIDGRRIVAGGRILLDEAEWREDHRTLELPEDWDDKTLVAPTAVDGRVDELGRLQRLWDTSSGRVCAVPVGNDATAMSAASIWRHIKECSSPVSILGLLEIARDADEQNLLRLVCLLEMYGLVHTVKENAL